MRSAVTVQEVVPGTRRAVLLVLGLVVVVVVVRLPFLTTPLSADEGGLLLVGSQWGPGSSLYGDYWVDRPPLLVAFFALADRLGGVVALRSLGLVAVACSVVAAAFLGAVTAAGPARPRTATACAVTAAVFLSTPVFGPEEVNGELLATPLLLAGLGLLVAALRSSADRARATLTLGAGAVGAAAVLVKQNAWDVLVVLTVLTLSTRWAGGGPRVTVRDALTAGAGATAVIGLAVLAAAALGTAPAALWDAVVVFRVEAAQVIGRSAGPATGQRLRLLVLALLVSGAPFILALLVLRGRSAPTAGSLDLRLAVGALLVWEFFVVVAGGSYWLQYLLVLVPGLVLSVALLEAGRAPPSTARWTVTGPVLAVAAAACVVALSWTTLRADAPRGPSPVVSWLRANTGPGDDLVIGYGHPDVLQASGLQSPYPDIWSLPVRVHDPYLHDLTALLSSEQAPDWVVLTGKDLRTWGIEATAGTAALRANYTQIHEVDGYQIYHRD